MADYLDEVKLTKKPKTLAAYTTALEYFTESCTKMNLEEIERGDLLKFSAFLRDEKKQSPRSVYNKFENVMTFLKMTGDSRSCRQKRLAAIRRERTGNLRAGRTRQALQSLQRGRTVVVRVLLDDGYAGARSDALRMARC